MRKFLAIPLLFCSVVNGQSYDPDAQAYFNRAGNLSCDRKNTINTFVVNLKDSLSIENLSDKFDGMWLIGNATETAAQKSLVADSNHITVVGSPTFVADSGYTTASGKYLNTNLKASAATRAQQNSNSFGVWTRSNSAVEGIDMGMRISGPTQRTELWSRYSDDKFYYRLNQNISTSSSVANTSSVGLFVITRTGASATAGYKNEGTVTMTGTQLSSALPPLNVYIGAVNDGNGTTPNGTGATGVSREYAFAFVGAGLTATEVRKIYNCVKNFYIDPIANGSEVCNDVAVPETKWLGWSNSWLGW